MQSRARNQRLVRLALPALVSVGVHLGLLVAIVFVGVNAEHALREPTRRLAELARPATDARPDTDTDPLDQTAIALPDLTPHTTAPRREPDADLADLDRHATDAAPVDDPLGALGATGAPPVAALLEPDAGTTAPTTFAGLEAHAAGRIVYVVDASGAVVTSFTFIRERLARSIGRLAPTQRFEIVFFRDLPDGDGRDELPSFARGTVRATAANRAAALDWIDTVQPAGRSDPAIGLARAFGHKPDLVFLLSTSIPRTDTDWGPGRAATLAQLEDLNPPDPRTGRRPVVVKTVQFLRPDPTNLLRDIAQLHGDGQGSYRLLPLENLDAPEPEPRTARTADPAVEQAVREAAQAISPVERDGSADAVLLGLAPRAAHERVGAAAKDALTRLENADDPNAPDARVSAIRARALVLLAGAAPDAGFARDAIAQEIPGVLSSPEADIERRLTAACARLLTGDPVAAHDLLADVIEDADDLGHTRAALRARLADRLADAALAQPQTERVSPSAFTRAGDRLLIAENDARARFERDPTDPDAPAPLLALLDDPALHDDPLVRRALVGDRLASAGQRFAIDWDAQPPESALARAESLVRDPGSRRDGLDALDRLARRADAGFARAEALWAAAVAERADADSVPEARARVANRLRRLAQGWPDHTRAPAGAAAAIALDRTGDGALAQTTPDEFLVFALDAFADHPGADRWRLDLARRQDAGDRLETLESIEPRSGESDDACTLYFTTTSWAIDAPTLERALAFAERHRRPEWFSIALRLAESLETSDPGRAGHLYGALAGAEPDQRPLPAEELRLRRGLALIESGDVPGGVGALTDLASSLEAEGTLDDRFWRAWAVALETIATGQPDPSSIAAARAHAARLRVIDPSLGGNPWDERLRAASESLDSP